MNSNSFHRVVAVAFVLVSHLGMTAEPKASISEAELNGFFESIEFKGTNIVFTSHKAGEKFAYRIDGSKDFVSKYSESITVPENSNMMFSDRRHIFLKVAPVSMAEGRRGFRVSLVKDFRSFGANITTNYAYLITADEKSDSSDEMRGSSDTNAVARTKASVSAKAGAPEKKFLKGLKLMPCD